MAIPCPFSLANLDDRFRRDSFAAGAAFGVEELKKVAQGVGVGGVAEEGAFAADGDEVLGLELVEMMGEGGGGDVEFVLNFAGEEALWMGGEEKLHDTEAGFRAHGGEHVGEFENLRGGRFGGRHISILAEIWNEVKSEDGGRHSGRVRVGWRARGGASPSPTDRSADAD